jgi:cold shock protein
MLVETAPNGETETSEWPIPPPFHESHVAEQADEGASDVPRDPAADSPTDNGRITVSGGIGGRTPMLREVTDHPRTGTTTAIIREWHDDEGWGVVDSLDTPGGCWAHFSHIDMPGFRTLDPGQAVRLDWESLSQDGYDYRAIRVVP